VLNQSTLFVDQLRGEAPLVQYFVNGRQYTKAYYLADGIYPEWAVFVKSIRAPQSAEHKLFLHLGFCKLVFAFCVDRHVYMNKGILRISC
jgi:hypothetical protein